MGQAFSVAEADTSSNAPAGVPGNPLPSKRLSSGSSVRALAVACGQLPDGRVLSDTPGSSILAVLQKLTKKDRLHLFQVNRACAAQVLQHAQSALLQLQADTERGETEKQLKMRRLAVSALLQASPVQLQVSMPRGWSSVLTGLPLTNVTHLSILGVRSTTNFLPWSQVLKAPNLQKLTIDSDIAELDAAELADLQLSSWLTPSLTHCQFYNSPPMRLLLLLAPQLSNVSVSQGQLSLYNEASWQQLVNHEGLLASLALAEGRLTISYCSPTALQVLQKLRKLVTSLRLQNISITPDRVQYTMQLLSCCSDIKAFSCGDISAVPFSAQASLQQQQPPSQQLQKSAAQVPAGLDSLEWDWCHPAYVKYLVHLMSQQIKHIRVTYATYVDSFQLLGLPLLSRLKSISLADHELGLKDVSRVMKSSPYAVVCVRGVHIPDTSALTSQDAVYVWRESKRLRLEPVDTMHLPVPMCGLRGYYNKHAITLCAACMTKPGGLCLHPAELSRTTGAASRQLPVPAADLEQLLPQLPSNVTLLWLKDIAAANKEYWYSFLMALPEHVSTIVLSDSVHSCDHNAAILTSVITSQQLRINIKVLTHGNPKPPTKQMVQLARQHPQYITLQWDQQKGKADLPEEMEVSTSCLWHKADAACNTEPSSNLQDPPQTEAGMVPDAGTTPVALSSASAAASTDACKSMEAASKSDECTGCGMAVSTDAHTSRDMVVSTDAHSIVDTTVNTDMQASVSVATTTGASNMSGLASDNFAISISLHHLQL